MDIIKQVKQQALQSYKFDIGRNSGVEFIASIIKFSLFFAIATSYIICLAHIGKTTVSPLISLLFFAAIVLVYFFAVAPINLGRNLYFTKVALKSQPSIDDMFHFYKNPKPALYAYLRIAVPILFYTVCLSLAFNVYFRIFSRFSNDYFSLLNLIVCLIIIGLYIAATVSTRIKYSYLPVIYLHHSETNPIPLVAKSIRASKGIKFKLFIFHLSFAGWYLLGILTFGIGLIWINPYIRIASKIYLSYLLEK